MIVPFSVEPYPDEILGSWVRRTVLRNGGESFWKQLRSRSTLPENINIFNVPPFNAKVSALLNLLEIEYADALMRLTTFPLYVAFRGDEERLVVQPLNTFPVDAYSAVLRLGRVNRLCMGMGRTARYCPICLAEDQRRYGETFWHRVHQLPIVFTCPEHDVPLRSTCYRCGAMPYPRATALVPLPSTSCACGNDLRHVQRWKCEPAPGYLRLARFGKTVLNASQFGLPQKDARNYLLSTLLPGELQKQQVIAFGRHLMHDYGFEPRATGWHFPAAEDPGFDVLPRLTSNTDRTIWLCYLAAYLGNTYDDVVSSVRKHIDDAGKRTGRMSWDVPTARLVALRLRSASVEADTPTKALVRSKKRLYWFLRLVDEQWLRETFVDSSPARIPDLASDRRTVRKKWREMRGRPEIPLVALTESTAAVRAEIRDVEWHQRFFSKVASYRGTRGPSSLDSTAKRVVTTRKALFQADKTRIMLLEASVRKIIECPGKPQWVSATLLAALAGISYGTALRLLRTYPALKEAVRAANKTYRLRTVTWAMGELRERGDPLNAFRILKLTKIEGSKENRALIHMLLRSFGL